MRKKAAQNPNPSKLMQPTSTASLRRAIAARLVELRKARGLTQDDVAEKSGLHVRTVSRLEGTKDPSFPGLDNLAQYLEACDATLGEMFAIWIRPNTTDYGRECYGLLLKLLETPDPRHNLKRLLTAMTKDEL